MMRAPFNSIDTQRQRVKRLTASTDFACLTQLELSRLVEALYLVLYENGVFMITVKAVGRDHVIRVWPDCRFDI